MMTAGIGYANSQLSMPKPNASMDPKKAWDAAVQVENMYVSQFMQQMFASNKEGMFGGGRVEVMFRSFFAANIAESAQFNLGIAESIYPTLFKNQGNHHEKGK
ncbi:rod-binding protein [Candidatus Paracaedibacter symbiosus]|uniref:rod-binding protein n=1 Tax=Candidatus Paracaedibacter symbiosus TaxID=244582 RepID=UPI0018DDFD2F|nr:rod-binding protein [Candidatus Paracaedibacter symbiosus]